MDLYRLNKENPSSFSALDIKNVFRNCVSLVEWSTRLPELFVPNDRLEVEFAIDNTAKDRYDDIVDHEKASRILTFTAHGPFWNEVMQSILCEGYLNDFIISNLYTPT